MAANWAGDEFCGYLSEYAIRIGGIVAHQAADRFRPGFRCFFMPFQMILSGFGLLERILNAATGITVIFHRVQIFRIVRNGGACMTGPNPTFVDPIAFDEVFEDQFARFDIATNIANFLFWQVIDFENDMTVVEGHVELHALCLNRPHGGSLPVTYLRGLRSGGLTPCFPPISQKCR